MLINFSIQNFGSVKDKQTLSFEADKSTHLEDYYVIKKGKYRLLKLGLIYGANASGKTTILKALDFLRSIVLEPEDKKTDTLDFQPFLFDAHTPTENTILSIEFLQNEIKYDYSVAFNKRAIVKEELINYNPNKATVFTRTTNLDKQLTDIKFGSKIKTDKTFEKNLEANTLWNNTVLGGFLKTNIDSNELKEVGDWFEDYLNLLVLTKTDLKKQITEQIEENIISKSSILGIIKKADFNISNFEIKEDKTFAEKWLKTDISSLMDAAAKKNMMEYLIRKDISFEHTVNGTPYTLPLKKESEGTQKYYGYAGLLSLLINDSLSFSIDELESSLHPDLYIHFLLTFLVNAKQSQLIATTHNREILNNKDIFRNDAIWFTDKDEASATQLYSLADFDTSVIRDTSNVYNAYKIGKLGGVPNLGDYYIETSDEN